MFRHFTIAVAAIMALAIASCSSESDQIASNPAPTQVPTPPKKTEAQAFNNPVVPGKQTPTVKTTTFNLIQPTNVDARVKAISQGRNDPFAQLIAPSPPDDATTESISVGLRPVPILPRLPGVRSGRSVLPSTSGGVRARRRLATSNTSKSHARNSANKRNQLSAIASANLVRKTNRQILPKVMPQVIPNPALESMLPPPRQPDLAKAVVVSGVVLVGQQPQAIIKVPNEPTSRYVQAGQKLANGLLVKRIEMNEGSDPVVILEQYGIEVARMVGEAPTTPVPSAAATGNPVTTTSPSQNPVSS